MNYWEVEVHQLSRGRYGHPRMTTVSKAMAWSMLMLTVTECVCVCVLCSFIQCQTGWIGAEEHCLSLLDDWALSAPPPHPECKDQTTDGSRRCVMEVEDVTAGRASGPWVFFYLFSTPGLESVSSGQMVAFYGANIGHKPSSIVINNRAGWVLEDTSRTLSVAQCPERYRVYMTFNALIIVTLFCPIW